MAEEGESIEYRTESRSSITITKNSKGYNWEIKSYYQEGEEDLAIETVTKIDKEMKLRFSQ